MRRLASAFALCLLALAPATGAGAAAKAERRVAILPLSNLGVDEDVAASLLGFLRAEVGQLPGVVVVDPAKAGKPIGGDCKGDLKCLAAAGARLGADELVYGTVAGVGDAYSIDLKRVLVRQAKAGARVTETLSGSRELLIDGVRAAAYKLLLPAEYVGKIQVQVAERDAEVFVDGKSAGKTPLAEPVPGLTPGKHALKLVKPGFADFDAFVDVKFQRISVVKVDLKNSAVTGVMFEQLMAPPPPELPPPPAVSGVVVAADPSAAPAAVQAPAEATRAAGPSATGLGGRKTAAIAVGGAGVLALGAGALFGALSSADKADALLLVPDGQPVPIEAEPQVRELAASARWKAITANVLLGAGAAAAAAGAVLWLTGDDAPAGPAPTALLVPGGAAFGIAGEF